jgi:hypothetical protein
MVVATRTLEPGRGRLAGSLLGPPTPAGLSAKRSSRWPAASLASPMSATWRPPGWADQIDLQFSPGRSFASRKPILPGPLLLEAFSSRRASWKSRVL